MTSEHGKTLSNTTNNKTHFDNMLRTGRIDTKGTKGRGGHEKWAMKGMTRPITLQTHIDPVPEHIVKNSLRALSVSRKEFERWLLNQ